MRTAFVYVDGDTLPRRAETWASGRGYDVSLDPAWDAFAAFASQVAHWQTACAGHIWADLPNLLQGPYSSDTFVT